MEQHHILLDEFLNGVARQKAEAEFDLCSAAKTKKKKHSFHLQSFGAHIVFTLLASVVFMFIISYVLPHCYYATRITEKMSQNNERIYMTNWYRLPIKRQRDFHMLLMYSQREYTIIGYGIANCSMATFLAV